MSSETACQVELLRHVVATIAYRGGKSLREAPTGFGDLDVSPGSRTPLQVLSHMGDVLSWALSIVDGDRPRSSSTAEPWGSEVDRFFSILEQLDSALEAATQRELPTMQLLQGPFADTLTHIGQLAMLRRLAGSPVRGENYFKAEIVEGKVGPEQPQPGHEFD